MKHVEETQDTCEIRGRDIGHTSHDNAAKSLLFDSVLVRHGARRYVTTEGSCSRNLVFRTKSGSIVRPHATSLPVENKDLDSHYRRNWS